MSNAALADAAGVHVTTVSQWRGDRQRPTWENLRAIAPLLRTTAEWLDSGADDQGPSDAELFQAGVNWAVDQLHRVAERVREAARRHYAPTDEVEGELGEIVTPPKPPERRRNSG